MVGVAVTSLVYRLIQNRKCKYLAEMRKAAAIVDQCDDLCKEADVLIALAVKYNLSKSIKLKSKIIEKIIHIENIDSSFFELWNRSILDEPRCAVYSNEAVKHNGFGIKLYGDFQDNKGYFSKADGRADICFWENEFTLCSQTGFEYGLIEMNIDNNLRREVSSILCTYQ